MPVDIGIITVEVRTQVIVREKRGRVSREWTEERVKIWNEVECPDYVDEQRLNTQVKATIKQTVNEMAANLKKSADNT